MAQWKPVLGLRGVHWAPNDSSVERRYREALLDGRRRVLNKFHIQAPRVRPGEAITNVDTGAPPAARHRLAADFQFWVKFNSWASCENCGLLQMRPLTPLGMQRALGATITEKDCRNCGAARTYAIPRPAEAPEALKGLDVEAAEALALVEIDVGGPEQRAVDGYRKHVGMIRFSWHARSADERVEGLANAGLRRNAKAAST